MSHGQEFRNATQHFARVIVHTDGEIYEDTFHGSGAVLLNSDQSRLEFNRLDETRATGSFVFHASTAEAADALDPIAGSEIEPFAGVIIDGQIYWEPLGRYVIESSTFDIQDGNTIVSVQVLDLSEKVRDNVWKTPFATGGGTYQAAIAEIMADRAPGVVEHHLYLSTYAGTAPEVTYSEKDDPWAAIVNLAKSSVSEAYFNKRGHFVVETVQDPATVDPSMTLGGDEFLVEIGRRRKSVSRREVFNGVICTGEAPWLLFPISGEFWDENPVSPTWRGGPFGEKPFHMGSTVATSDAQCAEIAEAEYYLKAGISEEIGFSMLKDPTLSVGAVIEGAVQGRAQQFYTVDSLTYPMGSSPMSGTVRRRRFS